MLLVIGPMLLFQFKVKKNPKLKAQILQMRYQNVPGSPGYNLDRNNSEIVNLSSCFYQSKIVIFSIFYSSN